VPDDAYSFLFWGFSFEYGFLGSFNGFSGCVELVEHGDFVLVGFACAFVEYEVLQVFEKVFFFEESF